MCEWAIAQPCPEKKKGKGEKKKKFKKMIVLKTQFYKIGEVC